MKHEVIVASLNSGVNTHTGRGSGRLDNRRRLEEVAEKAVEFVKRFTTITRERREAEEDSDEE